MAFFITFRGLNKMGSNFQTGLLMAIITFSFLICSGCEVENDDIEPYCPIVPEEDRSSLEDAVSVVADEDYSLPDWVQPEPYSGYIGHRDLPRPQGSMRIENWWTNWAELEPERGVYNWEYVENRLAAAAAGGYQLNLHILNLTYGGGDESRGIVVNQAVPDWVFEEFDLSEDDIINLGWEFDILIIPAWKVEIREAYNDLIRAFGERGYPQRPELASAYIHAFSPSRGEEFWMTQDALNTLERDHGFSPSVLDDWISARFAAYGEAFSGVTYKLAWVGKQGAWRYLNSGEYQDLALQLVHDAWDMGAGNRSSAVEFFDLWTREPALGQDTDDNGCLIVDESLPPMNSIRFFGDANEEYGEDWTWRFGSTAGDTHRYRFALLRTLQMRMRFLWTSEAAEMINPPLSNYVGMSLGKNVENSPDAWTYLRETPTTAFFSPAEVFRNFDRWLVQRDLPGGMTVPTQRTFREFNSGSSQRIGPDQWYDDVARRTDVASGNPYIFFDLDDRFEVNGPVQVKVEIMDDNEASWHLDYTNINHQVVSTEVFSNSGDGNVKTVTFEISQSSFLNGLDNGVDFRIACDGAENVTVRWVRVIRMNAPDVASGQ